MKNYDKINILHVSELERELKSASLTFYLKAAHYFNEQFITENIALSICLAISNIVSDFFCKKGSCKCVNIKKTALRHFLPRLSTISVSSRCFSMFAFFWMSPWYATLEMFLVFCLIRNVSGSSAICTEVKKRSCGLEVSKEWTLKFYLCQFALCLLKLGMILYIRLYFSIFGNSLQFRRFGDRCGFCLWNVPNREGKN